jgi:hypothetical protein
VLLGKPASVPLPPAPPLRHRRVPRAPQR